MAQQEVKTEMMKGLIKRKPEVGFEYCDLPKPVPQEGELLIKVLRASICGSDLSLYKWDETAKKIATIPFTPGHEIYGEVVQIGPKVDKSWKIGDKIIVENHYFCGKCYQCTHDQRNMCINMGQIGHGKGTQYGGCSTFTIVPARYAYKITKNVDPDFAVLLEPLAVAHQAVEGLDVKNEDVFVIGAGPIGSMSIALCKYMGAKRVIAADIEDDKLATAKQMGADILINSQKENVKEKILQLTDQVGIGRVLEASGSSQMANNIFTYLRKGGMVMLVGLLKEPFHIENQVTDLVLKSVTIKSIHGRKIFHGYIETEKLVCKDKKGNTKINLAPCITHRFLLSQYQQAFDLLLNHKACKIILYPQEKIE